MKKRLTFLCALALTVAAAALILTADDSTPPRDDAATPAPIDSKTVIVGSAHVHCLVAGPTDGRPVVLLHGARFTAETWRKTKTIQRFAEEGCRVYAVDLPGYGKSPRTNIDEKSFIADFAKAIGDKPIVLVAPSMSGRYALPFAINHTAQLAAFVPVAPACIQRYAERLSKITVPTLIVWGERDTLIPPAMADLLDARIPDTRKFVIKGASHPCYLDAPAEFNETLASFVRDLPAATSRPSTQPTSGPAH